MTRIGIDLGGTKIYGVVESGGKIKKDAKRKTPAEGGPAAVIDAVAKVVADLGGVQDIKAVGVGAPGAVDHASGTVRQAPNLPGWTDVPLGPKLQEALGGPPVFVDNDVNVATVAEHQLGAGKGAADVLGVSVGTGVGGGLVLGGQLRRGKEGYAGEIGHIVIRQGGRRCGCQGLGHLEAYAGRGAMEEIARDRAAHGTRTVLVDLAGEGRMTSSVFAAALEQGDPVVVELLDDAVSALGAGIGSAVTLLDVEIVVVGGGLADRLGPAFVGRVEQAAREQLFASASRLRVVPAALGDQAGALGAALITKA